MRIEQKTWTGNYKTLACTPLDNLEKYDINQMGVHTFAKIKYPEYSFTNINITIREGKREITVSLSPQEIFTMAEQLMKDGFTKK